MAKFFMLSGLLNAILAVMLGAFGAHALKASLTDRMLDIYNTASEYHFYHALGLIIIGLLMSHVVASPWLKYSGILMLIGIVLFSGSLYLLAVSRISWLGAITPVGGLAFILSWLAAFIAILKHNI
jgi:uncharacterized membrane protein YgdD (TMEM256/DUF423 family)